MKFTLLLVTFLMGTLELMQAVKYSPPIKQIVLFADYGLALKHHISPYHSQDIM